MEVYQSSRSAEEFEYALGAVPSIGENGNWFIGDQDTGIFAGGVDVTGAEVGQIIKIAAVDEKGRPTAWEAVDGLGNYVPVTKIVDYTVDAAAAAGYGFYFTTDDYPELANCNRFAVIMRKSTNGSMPWVHFQVNSTALYGNVIGKQPASSYSMCLASLSINSGYATGRLSGFLNPSLYNEWVNNALAPFGGNAKPFPIYIGELKGIGFASYTTFLDEGGRIEIWGWCE